MKMKIKLIDLYIITLSFTALSTVALKTIACFTELETDIMHFDGKLAITLANVLLVLGLLLLSSYFFIAPKQTPLVSESTSATSFIPAGIVCAPMLFLGFDCLKAFLSAQKPDVLFYLKLAIAILAFLSIIALFLGIFIEKTESQIKAAFAICLVIFLAVYSSYLYFNKTVQPTNSPLKIADQMAYLSASIFFIYETRLALGRALWKPYIAFGFIASLLTAFSSIPSLIIYIAKGTLLSDSLYESVLTLALCIFTTTKVVKTKWLVKNTEALETEKIVALANIRDEELAQKRTMANNVENDRANDDSESNAVDMENYTIDIKMPPAEYYGITEDSDN